MDNFARIIGLTTLGIVLVTRPACAWVDGVAAIVNDKVITYSEVKKQVDPTEKLLRDNYSGTELVDKVKEAKLNALKALIERQLIIQDFNKKGYFIPESYVEDRMKTVITEQFDGDRTAFVRTLTANGMSLENYKDEMRNQLIVQIMRDINVSKAVIVSPYQIEQYYQDNIRQFVQSEQAKIELIFLKKSLFKEKRTNAKGEEEEYDPQAAVAQEILYKLDTGSKFSELARSYSEGPKRDEGGDLGWVPRDTLRPELANVAFKLRPGQTSRIIETSEGYYIVKLDDYKKSSIQPLSDVRAQIEKTLLQEERERLQQDWIDGLRSKAFIKQF